MYAYIVGEEVVLDWKESLKYLGNKKWYEGKKVMEYTQNIPLLIATHLTMLAIIIYAIWRGK